jgi:riboflavin synthase
VFTGLISHIGEVVDVASMDAGRVLTVTAPWTDVVDGESIAMDGVCLTVTNIRPGQFSVAAVQTTLDRTTIGTWRAGRRVNLERALRVTDRLGGHIVQGHVDGVAEVTSLRRQGDAFLIGVGVWDGADGLCVPQGSITIDGVSLTVHSMPAPRTVVVAIVDYTERHTTLGACTVGDRVNIELDIVGKYVRQLAAPWSSATDAVR